jgi:hypothetical protein
VLFNNAVTTAEFMQYEMECETSRDEKLYIVKSRDFGIFWKIAMCNYVVCSADHFKTLPTKKWGECAKSS